MHPPKVETFDVDGKTNTDPKGFVRPVDEYRVEPWGLYMARPSDHQKFHYLESWLLPTLGLRVTIFHFVPEFARDQDHYVDIADVEVDGRVWRTEDHYLDVVVRTGRDADLIDIDELLEAHATGLLSAEVAQRAVERAVVAIDGIASHGHSLEQWLAAQGMPITWRE